MDIPENHLIAKICRFGNYWVGAYLYKDSGFDFCIFRNPLFFLLTLGRVCFAGGFEPPDDND